MSVPAYSHIVVVIEENHNYDEIIGNTAQAPFINSLAAGGAVLSNFDALTHPSQPNYYALYAGSTFGTTDDNPHSEPDPTIYTILTRAGLTFTGYVDESDSDINHQPWLSFPEGYEAQTDFGPGQAQTTFPALFPAGNYSSLPSVSYVIPGIDNDMHNGTIQAGDFWLQANLGAYAQWATTHNSLLVVVWDENDDESGTNPAEPSNQIPVILYGAHVVPGTYNVAYNDYNLLSTILGAFSLAGPNNAATASTIQVFGGEAISSTTTGPVVLSAADNPLVITGTGAVNSTGSGSDGIDGPAATAWSIANDGTVTSSSGLGISLQGGGTVSNGLSSGTAALISGSLDGIAIYGGPGGVINAGTIVGATYDGVLLAGSGTTFVYGSLAGFGNSVTNAAGGSISGRTNGVYVEHEWPGTVTNSGSIGATAGAGVDLGDGGSVTNNANAAISGSQFGVFIAAGPGMIANSGSISGASYDGIVLGAGGSITNATGASITGATNGVYVKYHAAGTVTNSGRITGTASDGVILADGGTVSNAVGGVISGGADGVVVLGAAGTVTNNGAMAGGNASGYGLVLGGGGTVTNTGSISGRDGLGLRAGGSVTNATGGSISGLGPSGTGVFVAGSSGSISNAGGISGNHLGVLFVSGGSVTNAAGGSILGSLAGVFVNGGVATLTNSGSIGATGGAGADIEGGGSVTNNSAASISGSGFGIFITGGSGLVANYGSLSGGGNSGVFLATGGSVTNATSGSISGDVAGVFTNGGGGTLANNGSITATGGAGADLEAGGSVTNGSGASISGSAIGVFLTGGSGAVANNGIITGGTADGIVLGAGGLVTNNAGASISGGSNGVYVKYGAVGTITNAGSIGATAAGSAGIDLAGGGAVTNSSGASIAGNAFGVFVSGSGGTITNAGTISGGSYAIDFANSATNRLVVDPGAVFVGGVGGGSGTNTLELASGTGSIGGVDTGSFNSFQTLAVDSGASWTLNGANAAPSVLDNGTLAIAGSLDVSTAINPSSTGVFQLEGGATLDVASALGSLTQMTFLASSELLIDSAASFGTNVGTSSYTGPQLQDFVAGDTIDLKDIGLAGVTLNYTSSTGILQVSNGAGQVASLDFQNSSLGSGTFHAASDQAKGIVITHS